MGATELVQRGVQEMAVRAILAAERIQTGATFYPMGERFHADPYRMYRRLREKDPIHRSRLINGWVLTRHADVTAVLRDPRFLSDERKQAGYEKFRARAIKQGVIDAGESDTCSMLRADPPDHTRLRTLVSRAFTPRTVEGCAAASRRRGGAARRRRRPGRHGCDRRAGISAARDHHRRDARHSGGRPRALQALVRRGGARHGHVDSRGRPARAPRPA